LNPHEFQRSDLFQIHGFFRSFARHDNHERWKTWHVGCFVIQEHQRMQQQAKIFIFGPTRGTRHTTIDAKSTTITTIITTTTSENEGDK
jgi:hypothetical protein